MKKIAMLVLGATAIALALAFSYSSSRLSPQLSIYFATPTPPDDTCDKIQGFVSQFADWTPKTNSNGLTGDEIAIYKIVIKHWSSEGNQPLSLSTETFPLRQRYLA